MEDWQEGVRYVLEIASKVVESKRIKLNNQ